jgi:hypothetical protein
MKRLSFFLFFLLCAAQWSHSQSAFLLRGQSGWGGGLGLSTNREGQGLNVYAGYSYRGYLDANLSYTKYNGGDIQGGFLTPNITFYLAKQEDVENIPTLGISLGFSRYVSKTTATVIVPDTVNVTWRSYERTNESTINAVNLGVAAQRRIGSWKVFFFQPYLGAGFSLIHTGWDFNLRGGISIGSRVVHGPLLIFTPSIERRSGSTTLIITFGAIF